MRKTLASFLGLLFLLVVVACSEDSRSISPTAASSPVAGVDVTGGWILTSRWETRQLAARAVMSDGSSLMVTSQATWESDNTSVATVSPEGLITAVGDGEATITATYQGRAGTLYVRVSLPA